MDLTIRKSVCNVTRNVIKQNVDCSNIIESFQSSDNLKVGNVHVIMDKLPVKDVQQVINKYNIMTDANEYGFEFFPYIYGLFDCAVESERFIYVIREHINEPLLNLIKSIDRQFLWFEIAFYVIAIDYYLSSIMALEYSIDDSSLIYKPAKIATIEHRIGEFTFKIPTRHLIVLSNFHNESSHKLPSITWLKSHITSTPLITPPPSKIITLLDNCIKTPHLIPYLLHLNYDRTE